MVEQATSETQRAPAWPMQPCGAYLFLSPTVQSTQGADRVPAGRTQTGIKLSASAGNLCVEQAEGVFELLAILPEVAPEVSKLFQARENRFHVESV